MIAADKMIIVSSAVVPGRRGQPTTSATALTDRKHLSPARFLRSLHPERKFAIAASSAGGRAAPSNSRSEDLLTELGNPLLLQVRSARAGGEIGGQSDSYSLHEGLLHSPAPASADQSGSFIVEKEGHGYGGGRGLSVGDGNFAISELSSRDGVSIFGAVKSDSRNGRVEVSATNDDPGTSSDAGAGRPDTVEFIFICAVLLFVFWLGNYIIPDLIFKDTVFKDSSKAEPSDSVSADPGDISTSEGGKLTTSNGESSDKNLTKTEDGESERLLKKVGTGFGAGTERQSKKTKRE